MSGKGSSPRPFSVPKEVFDNNFDRIFRNKKEQNSNDAEDTKNKESNEQHK